MTSPKSPTEAHAVSAPAPTWATLVATFFGVGRLRPGPGTWGSLAAALLWWRLPLGFLPPLACLSVSC